MAARVLMVDAIFFAELSQAGCRTRGVDGRLVHPALGRIQRGQVFLPRCDLHRHTASELRRERPNIAL